MTTSLTTLREEEDHESRMGSEERKRKKAARIDAKQIGALLWIAWSLLTVKQQWILLFLIVREQNNFSNSYFSCFFQTSSFRRHPLRLGSERSAIHTNNIPLRVSHQLKSDSRKRWSFCVRTQRISRERELAIFIYEVNVTELQRIIKNSVVIWRKSFPHNGRTQMLTWMMISLIIHSL